MALVTFIPSFAALWSLAHCIDRNQARAPSHRKAQRAQWRRGINLHQRPRRKLRRPRHYLVSGHLDRCYARQWRYHYKPTSPIPNENAPAPNILSNYLRGWAHRIGIVQWLTLVGNLIVSCARRLHR